MTITVDQTTEPVNLIWTSGDTQAQTFRFLTGPDEPMDLTSVFVNATARSTLGQQIALGVHIPNPTDGTLTIQPPLAGLTPDLYDYDIQFNDGHTTATWVHGRLRVEGDITR